MNTSTADLPVDVHVRTTSDSVSDHSVVDMLDPTLSGMRVAIQIHDADDIVAARRHARELGVRAGFSPSDLTVIATAISEITRNIVEYAGSGDVTIALLDDGVRLGVDILASDSGPGIADVDTVMRDGYSSQGHLGIGLPGARRLMDEFEIASAAGSGTRIHMRKYAVR